MCKCSVCVYSRMHLPYNKINNKKIYCIYSTTVYKSAQDDSSLDGSSMNNGWLSMSMMEEV